MYNSERGKTAGILQTLRTAASGRRMVKAERTSARIVRGSIKFLFLFGFCFVILYPVITMLLKAFMSKADLSDNSVAYIPRTFTLENIKAAAMTLKYSESLYNTGIITMTTTAIQVLSCLLVGYGFARHNFRGKNILFGLVLFTVIVPPQLYNIPYFLKFRFFDIFGIIETITGKPLNLLDTYFPFWMLGITCMGIKNGIFIYLFRQAFKNMPKELEEAGTIDGANSLGIFFKIMVPNAVTIILTVVLFSIVWQYNDVTYTRIFFISKPNFSSAYNSLYTISDSVKEFLGYSKDDVRLTAYYPLLKSAGTALMMLPLIVFYSITQKFFVQGVARSGIVG